jgi:hypothetical protein
MALDDKPEQSGGPVSTTESTNAGMLNQVMGTVLETLSANSSALIAKINDIASAITSSIIGGTTGSTANRVLVAKGTTGRALQATPVTIDPSTGNVNTNGGDLTVDDITADTGAFANSLTVDGDNVAVVTQTIGASFTFKFPENEFVWLILNFPFQWTITQTNTITEAGTATVTVVNGGVGSLTANSATTSINTQTQSSNNVVAVSGLVGVTFSSVSSDCENLCLTIWGTRVLAS